jgi:hypothetical protein
MDGLKSGSRSLSWAAGTTTFLLLGVLAAYDYVNFARWDNMETFLPAIWYAHTELLHGRFPFWNPHQNLGEPLHALGIGGTLYVPYTLAVAITRLLHWPEARALDLIAITHATFAAIGLSKLLTELKVRRSIAFVAALSATSSGYALVVGSIWVHVLPNLAWSVWAMWGLRRVIAREKPGSGAVVATVALAAVLHTGHVQTGANVWLAVWLWALGLAACTGSVRRHVGPLLGIAGAALLLAMPSLLPTALIVPDASRMGADVTAGRGFRPFALLGLLLPVLRGSDGALVHPVIVTTFAGAWVLPGLVLGSGVLLHYRKSVAAWHTPVFLMTLLVAVLCIWLNFGPAGGLYSVLHALPVWSHFRVPYKYFERAIPLLVISAALGLEMAARREPPRGYALGLLAATIAAALAWAWLPAHEPLAWLAGAVALAMLLTLVVLPPASASLLLVPLVIVQCMALIAITHAPHRSKTYTYDRRPDARLPLPATRQRVLPLSEGPPDHPYTRPLALFYAPTLDGYASASGHRFALTSRRLHNVFTASVSGVPSRQKFPVPMLLGSNFLTVANVGHLVVAAADTSLQREVLQLLPNARQTRTPEAVIVHTGTRSTRAYFAREQRPGSNAAAHEILFGAAPLFAASVAGDARRRTLPRADIVQLETTRDRFLARVNAPQGGLLVFSTSYSKEWSALIDGVRQPVVPVNEIFAGVWVPAGTQLVALSIRRWPLWVGLGCAALGALALMAGVRAAAGTRPKRIRSST